MLEIFFGGGVKIGERKWRKVLDYGGLIWYNSLMDKEKEEFAQGGYWERGRLIVHCSDYGNELPKVHHVELSEKSIEQIRKAFEEALRNGALERLGGNKG